jgi:hypothetical protein
MSRRISERERLDILTCLTESARRDAETAETIRTAPELKTYLADRAQRLEELAATIRGADVVLS